MKRLNPRYVKVVPVARIGVRVSVRVRMRVRVTLGFWTQAGSEGQDSAGLAEKIEVARG